MHEGLGSPSNDGGAFAVFHPKARQSSPPGRTELSSESAEGQSLLTAVFRADCPWPFGDPVSFGAAPSIPCSHSSKNDSGYMGPRGMHATRRRSGLRPAYVRGQAYLATRQGPEAATEFQKILDHRGIAVGDPIGALAHLQLGRAYALAGDQIKAKTAYQDLLNLWKDADPDIPVLEQAKTEVRETAVSPMPRLWRTTRRSLRC